MSTKIITIIVRDAPIVHFDSPEDLHNFVHSFPKEKEIDGGSWVKLLNPKPIRAKRKAKKKAP